MQNLFIFHTLFQSGHQEANTLFNQKASLVVSSGLDILPIHYDGFK